MASNGIVVTKDLAAFAILQKPRLSYYRETARVYGGLDTYYRAGLRYPLPDYANSLKLIRLYGPTAFYKDRSYPEGEGIANRIVADSKRAEEDGATDPLLLAWFQGNAHDKGYLELEDFKTYEAVWRTPVTGTYRGHEIITMPPPSGGGVVVMEMLNILEQFPLGSNKLDRADTENSWAQSSANHLHYLAEAQKLAYGDRRAFIADPDLHPEVAANAARLASKSYGQIRAKDIKELASPYPAGEAASHTNYFSIIDQWGNAIAVTNSQGNAFGSGVTVPGTGLLMTDQLGDWLFRVPSEAGVAFLDQPLPRARPMTSQTPTIVVRNGLPMLVTGGAGGPQIPMGVVETILNTIHFPEPVHPLDPPSADYGEHLLRALDAERIDAVAKDGRKSPYELVIEDTPDDGSRGPGRPPDYPETDQFGRTSRFPGVVEQALKARGHAIRRVTLANDSELETGYDGVPWIEAAGIDPATGMRFAACDPRHEAHGAMGQP